MFLTENQKRAILFLQSRTLTYAGTVEFPFANNLATTSVLKSLLKRGIVWWLPARDEHGTGHWALRHEFRGKSIEEIEGLKQTEQENSDERTEPE